MPRVTEYFMAVAVFLLANLVVGLVRVRRGPSPVDRLLSLLLFGTITVAILLLLAYAQQAFTLLTVALLVVMLAAIAAIAFTQLPPPARDAHRGPWS